jgi:cytochrome c oxidase assembly protein Cox11
MDPTHKAADVETGSLEKLLLSYTVFPITNTVKWTVETI